MSSSLGDEIVAQTFQDFINVVKHSPTFYSISPYSISLPSIANTDAWRRVMRHDKTVFSDFLAVKNKALT